MTGATVLTFAPLLSWGLLTPLLVLAGLVALAAVIGRGRGRWWRLILLAGLTLALLNPALVKEQREALKDVALVVVDRSPSQHFGDRTAKTDAALAALKSALDRFPDVETRVIDGNPGPTAEETDLFAPRADALSDVPSNRIAATFLLTDGQVHDAPRPESLAGQGPVHVLLTGAHDERDRRLEIVDAPGYGIVGDTVTVGLRIVDANIPETGPISLAVTQDGGKPRMIAATPGAPVTVTIPIRHGGPTTVEFEAPAVAGEMTLVNNRAYVVINGVRERLRVLLISGEPHAGERTWRNLLKADPSVDLVHFTILRPPSKNDGTPVSELSLIAFPVDDLFNAKLHDFDLIVFDHYQQMLLTPQYYNNLANYVRKGGAILDASGPEFEGPTSLYRTALRDVLPAAPTGREIDEAFKPTVTMLGERHPVTAGLPGANAGGAPDWGRWFRQGDVTPADPDSVVMAGAGGKPLLMLSHVGQGRVAQLASDQIWLWSRGYDGGGPQAELLRRLAHWLMKEPELDENRLTAAAKNRQIVATRRALKPADQPATLTVTGPDGTSQDVPLRDGEHGIGEAVMPADAIGLYKVTDGQQVAFAVAGSIDTPEFRDVLTTEAKLSPIVKATGGAMIWLADHPTPDLRRVDADAPAGGENWMGLRRNGRYTVHGVTETPLLPVGVLLILLGGALGLSWFREGR
jgi:hypothetical protein